MVDLKILALIKQVPKLELMSLDEQGFVEREGLPLEISAYCRRAVAKAVELARLYDGRCTVASLGSLSAEEALRECLAWGADDAVLLPESHFSGSDTLATAKALAALARIEGPFDLIFTGLSSFDCGTGQVGPQLAELLDLPFVSAAREIEIHDDRRTLRVKCERDDGWRISELTMPAVVGVAERLCSPTRLSRGSWEMISSSRVRQLTPVGSDDGSSMGIDSRLIAVEPVASLTMSRTALFCDGDLEDQVVAAIEFIQRKSDNSGPYIASEVESELGKVDSNGPVVTVLLERDRYKLNRELLWYAHSFAQTLGGWTVAISMGNVNQSELWHWGADEVVCVEGAEIEEDFARALISWADERKPSVLLAPASLWGREITSRLSASLGVASISDVSRLALEQGRLVGWKTASGPGVRVAIRSCSELQIVTVVPTSQSYFGTRFGDGVVVQSLLEVSPRGRLRILSDWRNDNWEDLARAQSVIGVGAAVKEDELEHIYRLADTIGAEVAATRKITDLGLLPRSRQIGITGRSISPKLYMAIGLSGKSNHMVAVRNAQTIVAINSDRNAPVFGCSDFGIVGDWREAVSLMLDKFSNEFQCAFAAENRV